MRWEFCCYGTRQNEFAKAELYDVKSVLEVLQEFVFRSVGDPVERMANDYFSDTRLAKNMLSAIRFSQ